MSAFSLLISPAVVINNLHKWTERSATVIYYSSLRWITWAPFHFRCKKARPVSYYAFFKGWLLPSPPPGCHSSITAFSTKWLLWDLSVRSGLFPFRLWTLAPKVCLYILNWIAFGVSLGLVKALGHPNPLSALPRTIIYIRSTSIDFAENQLFEFVWPFTPRHRSSPHFATYVGSVLQAALADSSTCPYLDHSISGQMNITS
jgi:hypothetical protein